ncbi:MAG TPA: hypothetical protein VHE09_00195 [Rhizomicrobium sp.]|jgi:hypothetical protein|nr:hypothetical protein [Rhizomicrobium sp.]
MEIIELPVEDEWPHQPGPEPLWQESVVLAWQDVTQSIGGFFRIGQHPNRGVGICTFGVVSKNGICFNGSRVGAALRDGDRTGNRFALDGFVSAVFDNGKSRWLAHDADCDADLQITDLHPQYDTWALSGLRNSFRDKFAASHTEVAGFVTGDVRLGGQRWSIDGYCFRDHSWGVRDHSNPAAALSNICWLVGSFGKDLVIGLAEVIAKTGNRFNTGFVIHKGELDKPILRDIAFSVEFDGLSMRGARARVETKKFGSFDLDIEGFGNVLMAMQTEHGQESSYLEFGMPGLMRCNGMTGGVHLSSMFNIRNATSPPVMLFGASNHRGLYQAPHWTPSGGGG